MNIKLTKYVRSLLTLAVPLILSEIVNQLQMIIDRAFLGHVNKIYMSALSNVSSPLWTSMSFCFSLSMGSSILISQNVGAGEKDELHKYSASLIKWGNVIPIFLFLFWTFFPKQIFSLMGVSENLMPMCLEYCRWFSPIFLIIGLEASCMVIMQTSGYTKPLVWYGIVRAGMNMFLDWVLIFGRFGFPKMGIKGAAIATLIAEYAGFALSWIVFMTSKKLHTRPAFRDILSANIKPFIVSAGLGFNAALEDLAWNIGNLVLISILNSIDEMAAGIYTMVFSIELLVVVVVGALGQGTLTLTSEATGRKDKEKYLGVTLTAYIFSVLLAVLILVVCLVLPDPLLSVFTNDKALISACGIYLIMMCINLYSKFANMIFGYGIRGSGNTRWMLMTQIFGTFFVISCAFIFVNVFGMGIKGVFLAVISDEFVRAVLNISKYISIYKKMDKV